MSEQGSCPSEMIVELNEPVLPVRWRTRKSVTRGRWFRRLLFVGLSVAGYFVFFLAGKPGLYLTLTIMLACAMLLNEFLLSRWLFCPACDVFLAPSAKRYPYAFCAKCSRLLSPDKILKDYPGLVDLNTIIEHPEPTAKLVGMVLLAAVLDRASEVIFEPTHEEHKLRYRPVNGTLYAPPDVQRSIAATVKRFAGMDCWTYDRPQSGNINLVMKDWSIECIAESQMHELGERIVIWFPEYDPPPVPDFALQPSASNFLSAYPAMFR